MKLRVIEHKHERFILCPNGSILKADKDALSRLLIDFKKANTFKGSDGYWNREIPSMEDAGGTTLAFVDDANKLVILSEKLFTSEKQTVYISTTEYADLHGKCRATIKNLCKAERIEGAYQTTAGWLIPKDAPYPERKKRESK